MASTFPDLPIFRAIASHDPKSTAIIHSKSDRSFTYGELLKDVEGAKVKLYHQLKAASADGEPIGGQRVAFLVENGYDYVGAVEAPRVAAICADVYQSPYSQSSPATALPFPYPRPSLQAS